MPANNSIVGIDWLNQNALRQFPITDNSSSKDVTGSFILPNSLIVDLNIPVPYDNSLDLNKFHLLEIGVFGQGITIKIGYGGVWGAGAWSTAPEEVCKVSISETHIPNSSYFMYGSGDYADVVGKVTIGDLSETLKFGGLFTFDVVGGGLVATTVRPDIKGVTSVRIRNGNDISSPLYGDVEFVAGANVSLGIDTGTNTITFNAVEATDLDASCGCTDTADRPLPDPIRTINGTVAPTVDGNINVVSGRCIQVANGTNAVTLTDTCSTPCCTSEELEKILTDQQQLVKDINLHQLTIVQLEARLQQLSTIVDVIESTGFVIS